MWIRSAKLNVATVHFLLVETDGFYSFLVFQQQHLRARQRNQPRGGEKSPPQVLNSFTF